MFYAPWDRSSQEARQTLIQVDRMNCRSVFFLSSGLCVLQAHRHLGGGGQLLVPIIGLRQGVWQQITGDAFSCPHILPWATRRCPIQRTSQGRPDNQVGGLDTLALSCEYEPNQVGSELQIPAHTPPLSEPLVSAAGERSKHLDVCPRLMSNKHALSR